MEDVASAKELLPSSRPIAVHMHKGSAGCPVQCMLDMRALYKEKNPNNDTGGRAREA